MLKKNLGSIDRVLRVVIGLAVLAAAFLMPLTGMLQIGAFVVAGIAIGTALISSCPLYTVLGLSSCPLQKT